MKVKVKIMGADNDFLQVTPLEWAGSNLESGTDISGTEVYPVG
jgi:hypothetical protein